MKVRQLCVRKHYLVAGRYNILFTIRYRLSMMNTIQNANLLSYFLDHWIATNDTEGSLKPRYSHIIHRLMETLHLSCSHHQSSIAVDRHVPTDQTCVGDTGAAISRAIVANYVSRRIVERFLCRYGVSSCYSCSAYLGIDVSNAD